MCVITNKFKELGYDFLSFFDFHNQQLKKTRITISVLIGASIILSGINFGMNQKINSQRKQIVNEQKANVNYSKLNKKIIDNQPNLKEVQKANNQNQGQAYAENNDNRLYQLSLMARHPSMQDEKPQSGGNQGNPTLSVLASIGTQPPSQDGNLFQKGVCLTGGNMEWYLENQLCKDMNLTGFTIGFDPYSSTVYSNQPLPQNVKQRIRNVYQACELVALRPNITFEVTGNAQQ